MIDTGSPAWMLTREWAEKQREYSRDAILKHGLSVEKTEFLRGKIACLNELLRLPEILTRSKNDVD